MFSTPIIFAAALAFQASAQTPPVTTPPSPQAGAAEQPAPARVRRVCERRALTGRRLEQTICYTPEQYAALVQAKRKELEDIQSRNNVQYDRTIVGIGPGPI